MKTYENLLLDLTENLLTVTINRPDKLNALNLSTMQEIKEVFIDVAQNDTIAGVILIGSGDKAFVAGADITEFRKITAEKAREFSINGQNIFFLIENCPKPVLAIINGFALGGGCELAMACHMRVAVAHARFGQPEVNLGILPGYGGTQRLSHLIGKGRALEYMMTADMIDAEKALQWGLVNHVAPSREEALTLSIQIMKKIASKAPIAIRGTIQSVNAAFHRSADGYKIEADVFAESCGTLDFQEGVSAFLEKRKANFVGK